MAYNNDNEHGNQITIPFQTDGARVADAVAALLGIVTHSHFEAEAPMRLEAAIADDAQSYPYSVGATISLLPAFDAIRSDWRTQGEYSVTFLDRYGNEIGKRGILHNDSVELEDLPDHLVQAVLATEDRRFFVHFGIDFIGTARAMMENARAGTIVQGGS